jgi:hypothetical protein
MLMGLPAWVALSPVPTVGLNVPLKCTEPSPNKEFTRPGRRLRDAAKAVKVDLRQNRSPLRTLFTSGARTTWTNPIELGGSLLAKVYVKHHRFPPPFA